MTSTASTARCFGVPSGAAAPSTVICNGPSTPNPMLLISDVLSRTRAEHSACREIEWNRFRALSRRRGEHRRRDRLPDRLAGVAGAEPAESLIAEVEGKPDGVRLGN